jgi:hypothetical protein
MRWRRVHGAMLGLPGEVHAGLVNWKEGTHRHWLEGRRGSEARVVVLSEADSLL